MGGWGGMAMAEKVGKRRKKGNRAAV